MNRAVSHPLRRRCISPEALLGCCVIQRIAALELSSIDKIIADGFCVKKQLHCAPGLYNAVSTDEQTIYVVRVLFFPVKCGTSQLTDPEGIEGLLELPNSAPRSLNPSRTRQPAPAPTALLRACPCNVYIICLLSGIH